MVLVLVLAMVLSPYLWQVVYVIYYVISRIICIYQTNCSKMVKVRKELTMEQKNVIINMHKEHFSHTGNLFKDAFV